MIGTELDSAIALHGMLSKSYKTAENEKDKMREREATVTLRAKDLVTDSDKTLFKGFVAGSVACEGEKRSKLFST